MQLCTCLSYYLFRLTVNNAIKACKDSVFRRFHVFWWVPLPVHVPLKTKKGGFRFHTSNVPCKIWGRVPVLVPARNLIWAFGFLFRFPPKMFVSYMFRLRFTRWPKRQIPVPVPVHLRRTRTLRGSGTGTGKILQGVESDVGIAFRHNKKFEERTNKNDNTEEGVDLQPDAIWR